MEDKDKVILHSEYHYCGCPGDASRQGISSHGVSVIVLPECFDFSTGSGVMTHLPIFFKMVSLALAHWPQCQWSRHKGRGKNVTTTKHNKTLIVLHDDVIKWKLFPRFWPFPRGIHRSPVDSPHKGQWRGALMFSLICAWINGWVNNREAGDLRRHRAHYGVTVMNISWGVLRSHVIHLALAGHLLWTHADKWSWYISRFRSAQLQYDISIITQISYSIYRDSEDHISPSHAISEHTCMHGFDKSPVKPLPPLAPRQLIITCPTWGGDMRLGLLLGSLWLTWINLNISMDK